MASGTRAPRTIVTVNLTGQTDFSIPFEYLARKFVVVTLLGQDRKVLTLNIDYRFVSKTMISLLNPTPVGYTQLELRRETSTTERLVDFHDGSILRAYDLNLSQIQTLHVAEEARDISASILDITPDGDMDARGRKLINLRAGTEMTDAVSLEQVIGLLRPDDGNTNTSLVWNRNIVEYPKDTTYVPYIENGYDKFPRLRINGIDYVPRFTDTQSFVILSVSYNEGIGKVTATTSVGDRVFSSVYATPAHGSETPHLVVRGVFSSVANDNIIQAAINEAMRTGQTLYWKGVYEVQNNLKNFHKVHHSGPGGVKRGSATYYVKPSGSSISDIHCSPTGLSVNDGLTADKPMGSLQDGLDALEGMEQTALETGAFRIRLAAGTYSIAKFSRMVAVNKRLEIAGPEANFGQPTAIIDANGVNNAVGLYLQGGTRWKLTDVHVTNAPGSNGQGVSVENDINLWAYNVWIDRCEWIGLNASFKCRIYTSGGKYWGNGIGIRAYSQSSFTVGYSKENRTLITDNTTGFVAQNASTGHVDDADLNNNATGAALINVSRAHFLRTGFDSNNVSISADSSSTYIKNSVTITNSKSFPERCRGFSIPNEDSTEVVYYPADKRFTFGQGRAGVSVPSGIKYAFEFDTTDTGMNLYSANSTCAFGIGNKELRSDFRMMYTFSTHEMRFVLNNTSCYVMGQNAFRPWATNVTDLGTASARFRNIYGAVSTIVEADATSYILSEEVDDEVLDVWEKVRIRSHKSKAAVLKKGTEARRHVIPLAQTIRDAFEEAGLDGTEYGLLCYDKWDDQYDADGVCITKAGEQWSIRPDQCLFVEAAYVRRRLERLEARLAKLEGL